MLVSKLNIFGWLHVAKQQRNIFFSVKYSLMSMTHKKRKISMMNDAILMQSISIVSRNSSCFEFFSPSCFIFIGKNITFVCTRSLLVKRFSCIYAFHLLSTTNTLESGTEITSLAGRQSLYIFASLLLLSHLQILPYHTESRVA